MSAAQTFPPSWAVTALGEVTVKKVEQGPPEKPINYIDISSINRETKRVGETRVVDSETAPTRARQWVQAGDVLVSMTRPNLNAVALVGDDLDGVVASTGFDVLRPLEVLPRWVFYRVQSHDFVSDVCKDLQGVVYPAIRPHDVRRHEIPIPPLPEQYRIVEAIETQFTRLDAAAETLKLVQANLKRYRASVLKAAVEGRLVPTEAELARQEGRDYEPASVLLERILEERRRRWEEAELAKLKAKGKEPKNDRWKAKYKEPAGPDSSELPELPEGWSWTTVDALAEVQGGLAKGKKRRPTDQLREVPYLRVANVQRGFLDLSVVKTIRATEQEIRLLQLQAGDVLFNEGGDRDKLGRGWVWNAEVPECIHQNHVFRARLFTADVLPTYLSRYANSTGQQYFFAEGKQTTNLASISLTRLRNLPVPLPPLAEQERMADELDDLISIAETNEAGVERDLIRCQRLRQSILKWAFEGKLVDQDPEDEPASALLERIRSQPASSQHRPRTVRRRNSGRPQQQLELEE